MYQMATKRTIIILYPSLCYYILLLPTMLSISWITQKNTAFPSFQIVSLAVVCVTFTYILKNCIWAKHYILHLVHFSIKEVSRKEDILRDLFLKWLK